MDFSSCQSYLRESLRYEVLPRSPSSTNDFDEGIKSLMDGESSFQDVKKSLAQDQQIKQKWIEKAEIIIDKRKTKSIPPCLIGASIFCLTQSVKHAVIVSTSGTACAPWASLALDTLTAVGFLIATPSGIYLASSFAEDISRVNPAKEELRVIEKNIEIFEVLNKRCNGNSYSLKQMTMEEIYSAGLVVRPRKVKID